jgi:succinoglycan biosynthesis protein ExoM
MNTHLTVDIDISICICTFKRPLLLDRLLGALTLQQTNQLHLEVIVVDNDPEGSAQHVIHKWQQHYPYDLTGITAPIPNIALARNAAVAAARGTWILFIDDDEMPDSQWVIAMHHAQQHYSADVVFGPVLPSYTPTTPEWIKTGCFFDRRRFKTGTHITTQDARTGNVLIRRTCLQTIPGPFDSQFGRTGAEDTMLFKDMLAQGARFIWCDEATVSEEVPASRANLTWLLKRSYRLGQTYVLSEIVRLSGQAYYQRACYLALRAFIQLGVAATLTLLALPFSRITATRWLRTTSAQCGKLSALAGHRYHEYGN